MVSAVQVELTAKSPETVRSGMDMSMLILRSSGGSDILEDQPKNCGKGPEQIQQNYGPQFLLEFYSDATDPPPKDCSAFSGAEKNFCHRLWLKPGWYEYEFNTNTMDEKWHKNLSHLFVIRYLEALDPDTDLSSWAKEEWQVLSS